MHIEICNVILFENIIEIGYIREYPVNVDELSALNTDDPATQDVNFKCFNFYHGSFALLNLPTPYFLKDEYPGITLEWYQGNGGRENDNDINLQMSETFYPNFTTSDIGNFGFDLA